MSSIYCVPIWLSNWKFKDSRGTFYTIKNVVVKGYNKGEIFLHQKTVNKVVKKIIGARKKHSLIPVNLVLTSQHGFGIEDK